MFTFICNTAYISNFTQFYLDDRRQPPHSNLPLQLSAPHEQKISLSAMDPTWNKKISQTSHEKMQIPHLVSIIPAQLLARSYEGRGVEGNPGKPGMEEEQ